MIKGIILLSILFSSCATRIENGSFRFTTYSNAAQMTLVGPGVRFEATGLNNSLPTGTAIRGASQFVSNVGVAALPFSSSSAAVRAAPIIPATLPVFRIGESKP